MKRKVFFLSKRSVVGWILLLWFFPVCIILADDISLFEHANDLLREHNYTEAFEAYAAFVKENPKHRLIPAAKWTMANIYLMIQEEYKKAADIYEDIINENPDTDWDFFSYDRLLVCYRNVDDHTGLIRIYQEFLTKNPAAPSAPEYQFNLAQAYMDINDFQKAADNFMLVVDRYPVSNYAQRVQGEHTDLLNSQIGYDWEPFSAFQSALELNQTVRYKEASTIFDEVIKSKKNTGMEYAARFQKDLIEFRKSGDAVILREKLVSAVDNYPYGIGGARTDALEIITEIIIEAQETTASDPQDDEAYGRMAFSYYQARAYYPAIEAYKKAISVAPDNTALYYNMLGYSYIGIENYDDAIATFQQLIDVAPEDPNSYDSMAEAYYLQGDTTTATQFYERALAVDSSFSNPNYMLGQIYYEMGRNEKAIAHLERYLEIDPDGFRSQDAQNLLNQMREEQ